MVEQMRKAKKDRGGRDRHVQDVPAKLRERCAAAPMIDPKPGLAAAQFPIAQVLLHALDKDWAEADKGLPAQLHQHRVRASVWLTLLRFWDAKTIGDVNADTGDEYDKFRNAEAARAGKTLNSNGRMAEKSALRKALRRFIEDHALVGSFDLPNSGKPEPYARTRIRREHLARLLWAARGRRWDADGGRWRPSPPWDRARPWTIRDDPAWTTTLWRKRERRHVARAIIVAAYTASTSACVTRLRWVRDQEGDTAFVDLDAEYPTLHRIGADAGRGRFAGMPVLLPRRAISHMRRWREADARLGHERLVHYYKNKGPLAYPPTQSFANIVADAGLPKRLRFNDLRFSAGAHMARAKGTGLRSGALMMGTKSSYFIKVYGHLSEHFQIKIMEAFARKPGGKTDQKT